MTTHNTQNIHALGGNRTHSISRRTAAKLPPRLCGHWYRLWRNILNAFILNTKPPSFDNFMPTYHQYAKWHNRKTTLYKWITFPFLFLSLKTHFVTSPSCRSHKHDVNYLWIPSHTVSQSYSHFNFFLWLCGPTRAMASSFTRFLDHTQRRTTVGRTPLDEWSARRRDLYLTTNIHNSGGIRTHNLNRLAAVDLCLRLHDHWDRHSRFKYPT